MKPQPRPWDCRIVEAWWVVTFILMGGVALFLIGLGIWKILEVIFK